MPTDISKHRAALLARLRQFFADQGVLEVDTPALATQVIPEAHIDLLPAGNGLWLQASPERAMKELLCQGSGPIYQIGKCYRAGDWGRHHRPEFTMVEWYVPGDDMPTGIDRLTQLVAHFLDTPPCIQTSYAQAFDRVLGINPHESSLRLLRDCVTEHVPQSVSALADCDDRDEWLNVLLSHVVEPTLGIAAPEIVYHYPVTQSALARVTTDGAGHSVAERFELYYQGVELANGYHELTDTYELRARLTAANAKREASGREVYPLPERLLELMHAPGLPPTTGVALGFDRLLMVALGASDIAEVLPNKREGEAPAEPVSTRGE